MKTTKELIKIYKQVITILETETGASSDCGCLACQERIYDKPVNTIAQRFDQMPILRVSGIYYGKLLPNKKEIYDYLSTHLPKRIERMERGYTRGEQCFVCGVYTTATTTFKNQPVCPDCQTLFDKCDLCNQLNIQENLSTVEMLFTASESSSTAMKRVCDDCARTKLQQCGNCNVTAMKADITTTMVQGNREELEQFHACPLCQGQLQTCAKCTVKIHPTYRNAHPRTGQPLCSKCIQDVFVIHDYNYKARVSPHKIGDQPGFDTTQLYMGVELEFEKEKGDLYEAAEAVVTKSQKGFFHAMRDGSLGNGTEFVSQPFTFKWMNKNEMVFAKFFDLCAKNGFSAQNKSSCGMHVHMAASAFSYIHLHKFLKAFQYKPLQEIAKAVGRRFKYAYCDYSFLDKENLEHLAREKRGDKHRAVNLANQDTIEIRIFNGVDTLRQFKTNLQFLHSMFKWAKTEKIADIKRWRYLRHVRRNKAQYTELFGFLEAMGYYEKATQAPEA